MINGLFACFHLRSYDHGATIAERDREGGEEKLLVNDVLLVCFRERFLREYVGQSKAVTLNWSCERCGSIGGDMEAKFGNRMIRHDENDQQKTLAVYVSHVWMFYSGLFVLWCERKCLVLIPNQNSAVSWRVCCIVFVACRSGFSTASITLTSRYRKFGHSEIGCAVRSM